ncbi:MAG: hypothetical protein ACI97A_002055 [Planctomycetota bacterium]|jgi:hypothetical protein
MGSLKILDNYLAGARFPGQWGLSGMKRVALRVGPRVQDESNDNLPLHAKCVLVALIGRDWSNIGRRGSKGVRCFPDEACEFETDAFVEAA